MPNLRDHAVLHFIVLIWGFTAILGKLITIPAVELVFYRTLIASIALGLIITRRRRSFRMSIASGLKILGTGMLISAHWILFFASVNISTVSVCLAGMATATLWTSILDPLITGRKVKGFEINIGLVIILGLYVVFRFEFNHFWGILLALISAMLAALFTVINSKLIKKHDHSIITFYEMAGACIGSALFFPFYTQYFVKSHTLHLVPDNAIDWLYIGILAIICTVYAYTVAVKLMNKFSPFAINLTVNLEPVYGIVLAFIIFGDAEKMTAGFYFGTLIILAAVLAYPYLDKYFAEKRGSWKMVVLLAAIVFNESGLFPIYIHWVSYLGLLLVLISPELYQGATKRRKARKAAEEPNLETVKVNR
ncbi:DMT family transporter [uncultured Microscilla sp.]|uniref:DMT family transporter n=1 Tax=uncultured Microscilla sp. TaxID=432653 RepID=UPI003452B639